MNNEELRRLIGRIADRDKTAFDDFYRAMERPVFRFIRTKLNDPFLAADILHDAFLEVWRGAGGFQDRSSVKTWIFSIAYRKVIDVFRKESRFVGEEYLPDRPDDAPDADQCVLAAQEKAMLHHCLGVLKPDHRSAIELTFFEDMSYREVSEVIGVPEGTVKTRVFHAKSLLLRCLEAQMKPGARQ